MITSRTQIVLLLHLIAVLQYIQCQMFSKGAYSNIAIEGNFTMLTFDDGPDENVTPLILDILKQKNVKATFFVLGKKASKHPELLQRMHNEGHDVANHGWDHPRFTSIGLPKVLDQLKSTTEVIYRIIGKNPLSMRPPYGSTKPGMNGAIGRQLGLKVIMWDVDTLDWKNPLPSKIISHVEEYAHAGGIILCHDVMPCTAEAMVGLVDVVRAKGLEFITIAEALQRMIVIK